MEKEKQFQEEHEGAGMLVESKVLPDETIIEFYRDSRKGMHNYYLKKNFRGDIIEYEEMYPDDEAAAMRIYFAERGIALTDDDVERIKEKFIEAREDEQLDVMLNDIDEKTNKEQ